MEFPGMRRLAIATTIILLSVGCKGTSVPDEKPEFESDITGDARPWTDRNFDAADHKFTFAVHSDLTGGERPDIYQIAIAQLSLLRPEFIINVGDLIEGGTEDLADLGAQWDSFDQRAARAKAPVFYVAGNHDRTGEVMQRVWDARQGRAYYHFRYKDTLFLVLDTEDNTPERVREINDARNHALQFAAAGDWDKFNATAYANLPENRGGNITAVQSQYMLDAIAANADVRWTFLFMHKAPWLREDLTAFTAIEGALEDRPYTVFHGHVHAYQHEQRKGRDYIRLATTGGVQLPENGRSMDHVTMVTVDNDGVDIANLLMEGILDKTGRIPLNGDDVCFESTRCQSPE
jgi:predicted phosphodiesterase